MSYWLMKSEPDEFGIDDLMKAPSKSTEWTGVRNFQARNFMRDGMKKGDLAFFYHSSCAIPGIAGIMEVVRAAYPDPTQFDKKSEYFDQKSKFESPTWVAVELKGIEKVPLIPLEQLRQEAKLSKMRLLQRGNRLSVMPVMPDEWTYILKMKGRR